MPGGDGTGPLGQGPVMGRGGRGRGRGLARGRMQGKRLGTGPIGNCFCPTCGTKISHQPGIPCSLMTCPKCETKMIRE